LIFKVIGQGHRVKFLGEGIRHALRCPCLIIKLTSMCDKSICTYKTYQHDPKYLFKLGYIQ